MNIALIGNMNNNHFAVARYLRDRGVNARLLMYDSEFAHFHPAADSYDLSYASYCDQLEWGNPARWFKTAPAKLRRDLEPFSVLIGCGLAPAYALRAGRRLDIFAPYGSDLHDFTKFTAVSPNRLLPIWAAVSAQRRGIRQCKVFQMDHTNRIYEKMWGRFRGASQRWRIGIPLVYGKMYSENPIEAMANRTHWGREFMELRAQSDLMVFSHGRHVWGCPAGDPNQKGTDRLLRGFASFRKSHPKVKSHLVMLEYGADVSKTRALVAELQLETAVMWFPRMSRKDLMVGLGVADIVCTEFYHSWLCSGVIYEALVMGKPILGYRDDALYKAYYKSLYPILNAQTADEIAFRLGDFWQNKVFHQTESRRGASWYEEYVVEPAMNKYLEYFESSQQQTAASTE